MHHPPNCLYQVLLVRVYTDLQAPSTHSFLRLVLNVFFIQHSVLLLSGPQLPAVLFPSLHTSTTTCTFTSPLTTHSTLFTCCALSGQHQHHLYSHPGTHTSLYTSTDGCTLFTRCAPSGQHQHHLYSHPGTHTSLYTSTDGCTLFTRCAPSGQHQHHLYSHPGTHRSIHIYRWVKISDIPMLPSSNICSQILRSYLWWSLCILYSHTCQVRVIVGDSGRHCVMQHLLNLEMLINFLHLLILSQ